MELIKIIKFIRIFCALVAPILIVLSLLLGFFQNNNNFFYSFVVIPLAMFIAAIGGEIFIRLVFSLKSK